MNVQSAFEATLPRVASLNHLAEVTSVEDVGNTGRIEVRLLAYDGPSSQNGLLKARVCVPVAGGDRGTFLIPDVGDEVLVSFVNGDPRQAVVVGSMWNGNNQPAETLGGNGRAVDRWTIVGKQGTRIAIVEEQSGAVIRLSVSDSLFCEIKETGGGSIELRAGQSKLKIDSQGVSIETSGSLRTQSSSTQVTSPTVDVTAGQASFSGQVQAAAVSTPSVIAASYTPGAGNVW